MSAAARTGIRRPAATLAGWIIAPVLLALVVLYAADRLYNPERFRIENIEVHGQLHRVERARVREVVAESLSGNYFSLSLPGIEARVAELPWVFSASVRRRWPATLAVEVAEVRPVAKWGRDHWLHFTGDLVAWQADSQAPLKARLPVLSGPDHHRRTVWQAFRRWSGLFTAHGLHLDELRLDPRGLWHLQVSLGALALPGAAPSSQAAVSGAPRVAPGPVSVVVAREDAEARIVQFLSALRHPLMAAFATMYSVDLRHPNGFAVGWKAAPAAAPGTQSATQPLATSH